MRTFNACCFLVTITLLAACGAQPEQPPAPRVDAGTNGGGGGAGGGQIFEGFGVGGSSGAGGGTGGGYPATALPSVVSNRPGSGTAGAGTNTTLGATFTEPLDLTTINSTTFTLKSGDALIPGTVSCSGKTATFSPSIDLPAGMLVTATLAGGIKNLAGQTMGADYYWTFRTGSGPQPPAVIATTPRRSATSVDSQVLISATFSTSLEPATLNAATFVVTHDGKPVDGLVGYSGGMATFVPAGGQLDPLTTYDLTLSGMKDNAGEPMAFDYTWSFTTASPGM